MGGRLGVSNGGEDDFYYWSKGRRRLHADNILPTSKYTRHKDENETTEETPILASLGGKRIVAYASYWDAIFI